MTSTRSLRTIAADIDSNWERPYFGAVPWLTAMRELDKVTDRYGCEGGKSIVLYFLANASTFRGPEARRIKAELKSLIR